jgi:carbon starvation protein CstA
MAFYKVNTQEGWNTLNAIGGNSESVHEIAKTLLGPVGTVLAVVGVIICPITSGDTALRSCRLILGEWFSLDQKKLKNRIILTLPLFVIIVGISIWDFADSANFNILWRWFAWSNQVLAAIALWVATGYLLKENKVKIPSLTTAIPAAFMTAVVITYLFGEPTISFGTFIPMNVAIIIGLSITVLIFGFYVYKTVKLKDKIDNRVEERK